MAIHDFRCQECGHTERDLYFAPGQVPKVKRCPSCDREASVQIFDQAMRAQPNFYKESLGYGKYHPQLGMVLESYSHKQQLMKRWGLEEINDPVGGNRKLSEEPDDQPDPDDSGIMWGDLEDAKKTAEVRAENPDIGIR